MQYTKFQDLSLSRLGLGCMRLPLMEDGSRKIDQQAVEEMVAYAIEKGVNYFDVAWGYHGGEAELAVGKALAAYPRESFYLADKFPGFDLANMEKVEEIFEKQLQKCGVEYFDFYLFHNVNEKDIDAYLDPKYGVYDYLIRQKQAGRIRHLGFSAHGSREVISRFLAAYGDAMEFAQLQINWLDWEFQEAREKTAMINERGIPVWVMEPLRGGKLATLAEENAAVLRAIRPEESAVGWAFRFLQGLEGVGVVLSGMSNLAQLKENIAIFEEEKPLSKAEEKALLDLADSMVRRVTLPCTACAYCTDHCPQELDIPRLLNLYNEHVFSGGGFIAPMVLSSMREDKKPSACVGCRSCEAVCPQEIHISEAMAKFTEMLK